MASDSSICLRLHKTCLVPILTGHVVHTSARCENGESIKLVPNSQIESGDLLWSEKARGIQLEKHSSIGRPSYRVGAYCRF